MRAFQNSPVPVIGLYSPYPQAGKSTLADVLVRDYGFTRVKMADGLKTMLRALLEYQGATKQQVEDLIEGEGKKYTSQFFGYRTPRYAMQTLGTEWGRDCMGADFWADIAFERISALVEAGKPVVVDDMRFENEVHMLRQFEGCSLVKVTRPSIEAVPTFWSKAKNLFSPSHRSEGNLNKVVFDLEMTNDFVNAQAFIREAVYEMTELLRKKNFSLTRR